MSPTPDLLVRTQHRRRRYTALVWTLAAALLAVALAGAEHLGWFRHGVAAGLPFAAAAVVSLGLWLVCSRRIDERLVARDLDAGWRLKARIEAAAELSADRSAFASAQRADAASRLAGRRLPRAPAWHAGQLVLILALLFILLETTVFTIRIFRGPPAAPPPPEDISASIDWRAPESELKAASIEEIPLAASAESRTGFRSMSLEISINGEPRLSLPLDAETLKTLAKPGAHSVKLPLYLDETNAAEFDMVAYHLRADRATRQPAPPVTSPLQFIQIRPAREDVERIKPMPGKGDKMGLLAALIGNLKAAQLALLKQNFLLAHAPIARTEKAWIEASTTVAADQKTLAAKAAEARTFAIAEALPALVVDNLTQIIPLMEEASTLIGETKNEPAIRPQGRSLALITELEKLIRKILLEMDAAAAGTPPPPTPSNPDPFKDDQRYKLPPRKSTAAGQLEQLAKDQADEAKKNDPSDTPSPSPADQKPSSAADQAELARRAEELAKNQQLGPDAQKAAAQAARDASAAAAQLKQGDPAAARAPAHAAAETLREAAAAQEKAGREAARAQLEAARRALNQAAAEPDAAARAAQLEEIARQLQADARAQQESGSAEAARQLAATAAEAARAAQAAHAGNDAPGDQTGDKTGNINPSPRAGGNTGPEDKNFAPAPSGNPGARFMEDPSGDHTARSPDAGLESGAPPGQEPGTAASGKPDPKGSGQKSSPGPGDTPDKDGTPGGEGKGRGPGSEPDTKPGSAAHLSPADRAAQVAASAQSSLSDRADTINRALRQLRRGSGDGAPSATGPGPARGSVSGSNPGSSMPSSNIRVTELLLGAQLAQAVLNTPESAQAAGTVVNTYRRNARFSNVVMTPDMRAAVDRLRLMLAAAASDDRRDETIRRFNPEDLDPSYREAIEAYFERLSREARLP